MKKLLVLLLLVSQSTLAGEVFCEWPYGLQHVQNLSQAQGPHYVGEPFVLQVDRAADWSYQYFSNPIQNLGTYSAYEVVGIMPSSSGQYTLRAFRVQEGYCTLSDTVLTQLSVGTIAASGSLWTVNPITFSAPVSGGAAPKTYAWTFGDGGTSTAQSPTHSYNKAGTFTVSLTVTDANGRQASNQRNFSIANNPNVPGQPGLITAEFAGCSGGRADYTIDWTAGGGQPSNFFLYRFKSESSSTWAQIWTTYTSRAEYGLANVTYNVEVRGCLSNSVATCGPKRTKSFTARSCGGPGGDPL